MIKRMLLSICLLLPLSLHAEEDQAIHEQLRAILKGMTTAINEAKYADLAQYFHDTMRVTTINQEVISSPKEIEPYFKRWFGKGGFLKKLHITLKPDALTELYAGKTMGIVRGSGDEKYHLSDSRYYEMKTRWTATVMLKDGQWKILSLHIGTNFLNNPILEDAKNAFQYGVAGGALAGCLISLLIAWLLFRRRSKNAA